MPEENSSKETELNRLLGIMARLRDPDTGCPWDLKQTMKSLTRYTIEEAYEVVDAIENGSTDDIKEELGDLLFHIVFYSHIAKEANVFTFDEVAKEVGDKLIRRHPHVFGTSKVTLSDEALNTQWDKIKAAEKRNSSPNVDAPSLLNSVPTGMPALMYAQKIQKACAKVGFDWPEVSPVLDKVREEVEEIQQELDADERQQQLIEAEIGDALFAMVNLARHCNVDADTALRRASTKFATRFKGVEAQAKIHTADLSSLSLAQMEVFWQQVKRNEK
ncbi:nucleoside triphosphate pyrophosphohydrolase [Alteromonas sp.]|nr:nucleoside triphosphate pyrophosphohydrolase [Alteromonas sp.]